LDFKLLIKNKSFFFKLLLFPTVLILVLGKAVGGNEDSIPQFHAVIYNEDKGGAAGNQTVSFGKGFTMLLKNKSYADYFTVTEVNSYEAGVNQLNNKTADVVIHIPETFTKALLEEKAEDTKTKVLITGNNNMDKYMIGSILKQYMTNTQITLLEENLLTGQGNKTSQSAVAIPTEATDFNFKPVSTMQYVSIAMVVMFSISTSFTLVHSIVEDKLKSTLFRIKSTPVLNLQYILGKLSGIVLAITVQMALVIIISGVVFQMKWGNPVQLLICTVCYSIAIGSIVLMWGLLAKDQNSISSIASPILYGFSFLGGSFISRNGLPEALQYVQKFIPNGKAINCYLSVCQGKGIKNILPDLLQLILTGVVFLVLSLYIYSGKGVLGHGISHNDKKTVKAAV
jgi:ABC-2 type transport system permease protein